MCWREMVLGENWSHPSNAPKSTVLSSGVALNVYVFECVKASGHQFSMERQNNWVFSSKFSDTATVWQ